MSPLVLTQRRAAVVYRQRLPLPGKGPKTREATAPDPRSVLLVATQKERSKTLHTIVASLRMSEPAGLAELRAAAIAGFSLGDFAIRLSKHRLRLNSTPSRSALQTPRTVLTLSGIEALLPPEPFTVNIRRSSTAPGGRRNSTRTSKERAERRQSTKQDGRRSSLNSSFRNRSISGEIPDVKEAIQGAAKAVFGSVAEEEKLEALFDAVQEGDSGMA